MAHQNIVDDSEWVEVMLINGYAVFMGYLMMGVRGVGVLIITWTTVVLLGGFVSALGKKDFWCLTVITLIQTAGVFNIILKEKAKDFVHSLWGLLGAVLATVVKPFKRDELEPVSSWFTLLTCFLLGIHALVLVIVLCPVAVLYVFGICISAGVGLWRVIEHDFGNPDGAANLKPALQVLYSLAVAQGLMYGYKKLQAFGAQVGLAGHVAEFVFTDKDLVSAYLDSMVGGCEKDPSFATGKNLVTYGVNLLINAKSNDGFIAGVKVLDGAINDEMTPGRKVLARHLLTRPSSPFSYLIQRLAETMGPRSPYSGKIRAMAARIVSLTASSILLEEHPEWIHYILSLLDTFEEYTWRPEKYTRDSDLPEEYERDWLLEEYEREYYVRCCKRTNSAVESTTSEESANYIRLLWQGFNTLQKLAVHPKNSRVNTEGLLAKMIRAPINLRQLNCDDHYLWNDMANEYIELMMQLAGVTSGETRMKARAEISRSSEAIMTTLECILECLDCPIFLKIRIVELLLHLSIDPLSTNTSESSVRIFTWVVLLIYLFPDERVYCGGPLVELYKSITISRDSSRLADEKKLSSYQELPLQQSVGFLGDLTAALVGARDIPTRVHAAKILNFLVDHYTKDDEPLKELKKAMVSMMPEVLKEIFGGGLTRNAETKAASNVQPSSSQPQDVDLEKGGVSSGGEGCKQTSSTLHQTGDATGHIERLQKELKQLCGTIRWRWQQHNEDADVIRQLDEIAEKVYSEQGKPVKTFKELVREEMREY